MSARSSSSLVPPRRDLLVDVAAAAASFAFALAAIAFDLEDRGAGLGPLNVLVAAAASAMLLGRRRFPVPVLLVIVVARFALTGLTETEIALAPAAAVAFYTVARNGERRRALAIAVIAATLSTILILTVDDGEALLPELLGEFSIVLLPVALGDAVRSREERVAAIVEAEAASRVQAERLRIARDLHDVVAHSLSAISVQSGVAAYNLGDRDPDDPAVEALERINTTGKRALEELRSMVGVLRSTDEADDAPLRPMPTDPDDFTALEESAAMVGVDLTLRRSGRFAAQASDASVVAVHRIAQEALTNVARHAGAVPATVELEHGGDHVLLRIVNSTAARVDPDGASTGVGIVGMRERAESLGGVLTAQPLSGGGFEVRAVVPYQPGSA
ncbi:MAG: histidine kinase [Actinomycetota bacterium]